ncbi:MAG TPA: GNAT family N-acetyltransferase [Candidatus Lokiarchaeia archaeon]|nr:GNAT family N-acetyltransferase [Candidatus Lokiarchaeia archaeon]
MVIQLIRPTSPEDFSTIFAVINAAAQAYKGHIPADRWKEPYMPEEELTREISAGVVFWGAEEGGVLVGLMGLQEVQDVDLIRHAYVRPDWQGEGVGGRLLAHLLSIADRPTLVGTWAAATWAIHFYEDHGYQLVGKKTKNRLLQKYWVISARQVETSVVLADQTWFSQYQQ